MRNRSTEKIIVDIYLNYGKLHTMKIKYDCGHEREVRKLTAELFSLRRHKSFCIACDNAPNHYEGRKEFLRRITKRKIK